MPTNIPRGVLATLAILSTVHAKKNVLFLVADDMRPEIGAYAGSDFPTSSHPKMHTPNLDSLAKRSLLLKHAYVQQAVCNPSRASLLTGRRPDTTHAIDMVTYWRTAAGNFTTIPQYFKNNGYATIGMGKIFHPGVASNNNDPISWTEPYFSPTNYWREESSNTWSAIDDEKLKDKPLQDTLSAEHAIQSIEKYGTQYKQEGKTFFIGVGFHKPHLPFMFPKSFLDYYPMENIRLPNNPYAPVDMPPVAWSVFDELRAFKDIRFKYGYGYFNETSLPDEKVKELRRAYYSAVSYTDSLIGKVVDALDAQGLRDDTVITFFGDHGWQLGEHGEWCKQTNFELTTHAPMMVSVPGLTDSGVVTERLTEFVDLFPTLAEAAELPSIPLCPGNSSNVEVCSEGLSFVPLMKEPAQKWKSAAFSQYPRMTTDGNTIMGYTMRTEQYRYTEWSVYHRYPQYCPLWESEFGEQAELYDHTKDPEENVNRVFDPNYQHIIKDLSAMLHAGWKNALPNRH